MGVGLCEITLWILILIFVIWHCRYVYLGGSLWVVCETQCSPPPWKWPSEELKEKLATTVLFLNLPEFWRSLVMGAWHTLNRGAAVHCPGMPRSPQPRTETGYLWAGVVPWHAGPGAWRPLLLFTSSVTLGEVGRSLSLFAIVCGSTNHRGGVGAGIKTMMVKVPNSVLGTV